MRFKIGCTLCFLFTLILFSCQNNTSPHIQTTAQLAEEFVQLRYSGKFRTDTLFEKKLGQQIETIRNSDGTKSLRKVLEVKIEWELIKGDQEEVQSTLSELNKLNGIQQNHTYEWLLAYHETTLQNYEKSITILKGILDDSDLDSVLSQKTNWLLASIYEETEIDSLAILHYQNARELGALQNETDYYLESVFHLGNMLYKIDEVAKSEIEYEKALSESKKYDVKRLVPFGYYHLGKVAERKGEKEKALGHYRGSRDYILHTLNDPGHFMNRIIDNKIAHLQDGE